MAFGRRAEQIEKTDRTYLVRFKPPELGFQVVTAANAEIHGEHLVLLNSMGKLAALFLMDTVESWAESPLHLTALPPSRGISVIGKRD
jgi:hypothetical protein